MIGDKMVLISGRISQLMTVKVPAAISKLLKFEVISKPGMKFPAKISASRLEKNENTKLESRFIILIY